MKKQPIRAKKKLLAGICRHWFKMKKPTRNRDKMEAAVGKSFNALPAKP